MTVKLALVGCGAISEWHRMGLESVPEIEITTAVDVDPARAEAVAEKTGAAVFTSLDAALEKGDFDEAKPWLERAIQSRRYDSYHFPHHNLGRVYMAQELYEEARKCFEKALKLCPEYTPAEEALEQLRRKLQ